MMKDFLKSVGKAVVVVMLAGALIGAWFYLLRPAGAEKKECEVAEAVRCVPVCIEKHRESCREKSAGGLTKNPVVDYAMCLRTTCQPMCELMAWSNCYLPAADRLQWKE